MMFQMVPLVEDLESENFNEIIIKKFFSFYIHPSHMRLPLHL